VVSSIFIFGSIVYLVFVVIIFLDLFKFLTSGIRAISLANIVGKYFLFLEIFFFLKKKEGYDIPDFFGYFYEKFAKIGFISYFLS
jgi:hypothetical protein